MFLSSHHRRCPPRNQVCQPPTGRSPWTRRPHCPCWRCVSAPNHRRGCSSSRRTVCGYSLWSLGYSVGTRMSAKKKKKTQTQWPKHVSRRARVTLFAFLTRMRIPRGRERTIVDKDFFCWRLHNITVMAYKYIIIIISYGGITIHDNVIRFHRPFPRTQIPKPRTRKRQKPQSSTDD